jgi:hypothetical protein
MPAATWRTFHPTARTGGGRYMAFASTIAHELLHSVNVFHHGEGDETVKWYLDATSITESGGRGGSASITILSESGEEVDWTTIFTDAVTIEVNLGIPHGQHSGEWDCLMRYDCSVGYASLATPGVRYYTRDEPVGSALCGTIIGTGINVAGRSPESRYSNAAAAGVVPGVEMQRGMCRKQIRVNDLGTEPER